MKKVLSYSVLFMSIWALVYFEGRYMIFIQEQTQLFQNDWHYMIGNMTRSGGFATMLKEAAVQFCHIPLLGSFLLSVISLAAFAGTASCIKSISGQSGHISFAALAPIVPLIYSLIVCEDAYSLVAYAVTAVVTAGILKIDNRYTWIAATVVSPLLFHACGAVAMLLPLFALIYGAVKGTALKEKIMAAIPLAAYAVFGLISIKANHIGGVNEFLMHRIPMYETNAGFAYSIPALSAWALALLAGVLAYVATVMSKENMLSSAMAFSLPLLAALTVYVFPEKEYAKNLGYDRYSSWAKLHYLYSSGKYDDLLKLYEDDAPESSIESNYINLALYRKGRLATDFFKYNPRWKHFSLRTQWVDMQFPFPFIWVEVCDEMGALAKAHQSAFEGNILAGPRGSAPMVKYLAEAEIIRGNYKTAEIYLDELDNTVFYRKWARSQREFLSDAAVASDEHYSAKRACYYDESRTLFDMNDLWLMKEVAKNSPKHRSTYDYTGIMILSAGELKTFVDFILEMSEAGVCRPPLPPIFQEALAIAYAGNQTALDLFRIDPKLVEDYKEYYLAVNGKMQNKGKANAVILKNKDKYWHYFYSIMKSDTSRK